MQQSAAALGYNLTGGDSQYIHFYAIALERKILIGLRYFIDILGQRQHLSWSLSPLYIKKSLMYLFKQLMS